MQPQNNIGNDDVNPKLRVISTLEVKEGMKQEALDLLLSLIELAKKEEGNVSYDLYVSTENPNEFLGDHLWSSKEAFDKHYNSQELRKDLEAMKNLSAKPVHIKTYVEVNKTR